MPPKTPPSKAVQIAHEVIDNCVAGRVRQINRAITARYDQELRSHGVTANQLTILAAIAALDQVTPSELQPYLLMDPSTISRNLRLMIDHQWLAVIPGEDRRSHYLVVAPKGHDLLVATRPAWTRAQAWANDILGDKGVTAIRRVAKLVNPLAPE